jgi:hypothetical protein
MLLNCEKGTKKNPDRHIYCTLKGDDFYKSLGFKMIDPKKLEKKISKLRGFGKLLSFCKKIPFFGYYDVWKMILGKMFKIAKNLEEFSLLYHISPSWSEIRGLAKKKADLLFDESQKNA